MSLRSGPAVAMLVTLGIIQFMSIFVYYCITPNPNLLLHIIVLSSFGMWATLVYVLPRYWREEPYCNVPDRIMDLVQKSWNEGLTSSEREELRYWVEESESSEDETD